jgi:hypothetical protein
MKPSDTVNAFLSLFSVLLNRRYEGTLILAVSMMFLVRSSGLRALFIIVIIPVIHWIHAQVRSDMCCCVTT